MNRFPKMMILWYVKLLTDGKDPALAMSLAHAIATSYAILKNRRGISSKKGSAQNLRNSKNAPDGWEIVLVPEAPFKSIKIHRTRDGVWYKLAGKEVNGTQKFLQEISKKFQSREEFEDYVEFAKLAVAKIYNTWKKRFYPTWKKIRDLDWASPVAFASLT